jgi:predicted NBD/HSP70 family sugar kinase
VNNYIAVDVGGTQIRVALFPEKGIVPIRQEKISTQFPGESAENRIINLIAKLWPENDRVLAIGIATLVL